MTFKVETFDRRNWRGKRRFYFRVKSAGNGETVAQSEAYNFHRDRDRMAWQIADAMNARVLPVAE